MVRIDSSWLHGAAVVLPCLTFLDAWKEVKHPELSKNKGKVLVLSGLLFITLIIIYFH